MDQYLHILISKLAMQYANIIIYNMILVIPSSSTRIGCNRVPEVDDKEYRYQFLIRHD